MKLSKTPELIEKLSYAAKYKEEKLINHHKIIFSPMTVDINDA